MKEERMRKVKMRLCRGKRREKDNVFGRKHRFIKPPGTPV